MKKDAQILDACCGSKMFWFDKDNDNVLFMDKREYEGDLCDGRHLSVKPDLVADFRDMPFDDEKFRMVVFDPPHIDNLGENSWMALKYGVLDRNNWKDDIRSGFSECFRVLEKGGFLIFKWNEDRILLSEVLKLTDNKPLFGNKRAKTHWLVFQK